MEITTETKLTKRTYILLAILALLIIWLVVILT